MILLYLRVLFVIAASPPAIYSGWFGPRSEPEAIFGSPSPSNVAFADDADEEMEGLQATTSQKLPDAAAALFSNPHFVSFNAGDEGKKASAKKGSAGSKGDPGPSKGKKK